METSFNSKANYRFVFIDFLKVIATFGIVYHHYLQFTGTAETFHGINFYNGFFYGGLLVELFFVISGFVISGYVEKIQKGLISFKEFICSRYVRLIPTVAISVIFQEIDNCVYRNISGSYIRDIPINPAGIILNSTGANCILGGAQ